LRSELKAHPIDVLSQKPEPVETKADKQTNAKEVFIVHGHLRKGVCGLRPPPVHEPGGSRSVKESWLNISDPAITLLAAKPSEAGQTVGVRLFNSLDEARTATISFPTWIPQEAWLCDALEQRMRLTVHV
jgi:alpha-mannosidase